MRVFGCVNLASYGTLNKADCTSQQFYREKYLFSPFQNFKRRESIQQAKKVSRQLSRQLSVPGDIFLAVSRKFVIGNLEKFFYK